MLLSRLVVAAALAIRRAGVLTLTEAVEPTGTSTTTSITSITSPSSPIVLTLAVVTSSAAAAPATDRRAEVHLILAETFAPDAPDAVR